MAIQKKKVAGRSKSRKTNSAWRYHKKSMMLISMILVLLVGVLAVNAVSLRSRNAQYKKQEAELEAQKAAEEEAARMAAEQAAAEQAAKEEAEKRLKAIREFTDLGSGFKIAMRDLEIRGAGNLLGREQHGNIASVGFAMYCHMLEDAIAKAQNGKEAAPPPPETPRLRERAAPRPAAAAARGGRSG